MWDLIVSVHDHCFSFYFDIHGRPTSMAVQHVTVDVHQVYIEVQLDTRGRPSVSLWT